MRFLCYNIYVIKTKELTEMKVNKSDIVNAIALTPVSLDKANIRAMRSAFLGFYTPKDANWSWELHAISVDNVPMIVASRFGYIVAEGK
jgi:hypothetical protein